ncbi:MAG: protein O-GlcNAcase [Chloroflexota bacterium]
MTGPAAPAAPSPGATSPFGIRGVIEGYYGRPWTHEQRLALIDFLAERGMDTFMYGPKDDPLVRRDWRVPYDGEALARLTELVERCRARGMTFAWCISPGLSIRYSDTADRAALLAKIASVVAVGARRIALLLDDIPTELQHPEDQAAYAALVDAHIDLVGAVFAALPREVGLIVCPTTYWGRGTEPYLAALGQAIDRRIDVFWTGREICSPVLDLSDAAIFTRTADRPPLYWDNYPVNDVAMGYELHIGPYRGRDPHLWRASAGIIANGMELFQSSLIPFATIADYLRDPEGYDPEASWARAIRDVAGEADAEAFTLFADNVRSSCLNQEDAHLLGETLGPALFRLDQGDHAGAGAAIGALADRYLAAADHLLRGPVANPALIAECRPWLLGFELGAQALRRLADLLSAGPLTSEGTAELRAFLIRLRRARVRVFGDGLEMTLSDLTGMMFRPGEVPELEGASL